MVATVLVPQIIPLKLCFKAFRPVPEQRVRPKRTCQPNSSRPAQEEGWRCVQIPVGAKGEGREMGRVIENQDIKQGWERQPVPQAKSEVIPNTWHKTLC